MKTKRDLWLEKYPNDKALLSWEEADYIFWDDVIPGCVQKGITEGQAMDPDDIEEWFQETRRTMIVLLDHYTESFDYQYKLYLLDLEYLQSLGKINADQKKKMSDKENFNFENSK